MYLLTDLSWFRAYNIALILFGIFLKHFKRDYLEIIDDLGVNLFRRDMLNDLDNRYSIEAQNVDLVYSDGTEAVKDISLKVPKGEFFGFLGPNGAGKTTFIKILVSLLNPTGGSINVNGFDLEEESQAVRESIGYMGQEARVDEDLTASENIRFFSEAYGVPKEERESRVEDLLELVELSDDADKEAGDFSGGMKKRLDAAMALVHEPSLIFLDEPTTGLDPKSRNKLWEYFQRINSEGRTIFLTTQYLEEADYLCERVAVIQDGEILTKGAPEDLKNEVGGRVLGIDLEDDKSIEEAESLIRDTCEFGDEATLKANDEGITIGSKDVLEIGTDVLLKLRDSGFGIKEFSIHEPTLDDVFLAITGERASDDDESGGGE